MKSRSGSNSGIVNQRTMAMHTMGMAVSARPMVSRVPSTAAPGRLPVRSRTRTLYSAAAPISRTRTSLLPGGKGEVPGPALEARRRCGMSLSPATKRMFGTSRSLKGVDFTHAVCSCYVCPDFLFSHCSLLSDRPAISLFTVVLHPKELLDL